MVKYIYIALCVALAIAGLSLAGLRWMQQYAEAPIPISLDAPVTRDGSPVVNPEDLPELYPVEDFSFTDQHGATFTNASVAGKIWVGYVFFTACPGQCPIMTTSMRTVSEAFLQDEDVYFAGFSVDPETDTPERLTQYATQYKFSNPRWHLLTGPVEQVEALAVASFRLGSVEEPEMHSEKFVLVDAAGNIRNYYDGTDDADVATLIEDIKRLQGEASASGESQS